jgi:hypothetical protein
MCGPDGIAVFDALLRRRGATDAVLQAFDLLEFNGEDLRPLPLEKRKARLARLLARPMSGLPSTSTRKPTAPPCSGKPARWAWMTVRMASSFVTDLGQASPCERSA